MAVLILGLLLFLGLHSVRIVAKNITAQDMIYVLTSSIT